jgi:branched-chain amino acid transport system permease protein
VFEGLMAGVMYSLVALGFCLIYKASGVFNFAQGIMMVFAALCMITVYEAGFGIVVAILVAMLAMVGLSFAIERVVLRPLVNQDQIIMFMATIGLAFFLEGFGEFIFGGSSQKLVPTEALHIGRESVIIPLLGSELRLQQLDLTAGGCAALLVVILTLFFQKTPVGRALRAVADDHQAALSVGIPLRSMWVIVWSVAGLVALVTGIMWGASSSVDFSLVLVAMKAFPVLILGNQNKTEVNTAACTPHNTSYQSHQTGDRPHNDPHRPERNSNRKSRLMIISNRSQCPAHRRFLEKQGENHHQKCSTSSCS